MRGVNVLLVEDNELNQEVATLMLKQAGIEVEIAQNGKEAVDIFLSNPDYFHIILMDLQMPIMSGYEATALIREQNKKIPIIALTAAAMVEDRKKVLESGMNDHLGKPINTEELYEKIACWCKPSVNNFEKISPIPKNEDGSILDVAYALKIVSGKKELLNTLLFKFLFQLNEEFADLSEQITNNDPFAASQIHALKGVSGNLGAKALFLQCSRIDLLFKEGKSIPDDEVQRFVEAVEALKDRIKEVIISKETLSDPFSSVKLNPQEVKNLFEQIQNDLKLGNMIQSDDLYLLIQALHGSVNQKELIMWREAIEEFNYDSALEVMNQWKL